MDSANSRRFTPASWVTLILLFLLIVWDIGQTVYRFRIPTDGWNWHTGAFGGEEQDYVIYQTNLVGAPSPLEPGDWLTAVEGVPVAMGNLSNYPEAYPRLGDAKPGDTLTYRIIRQGQPLEVQVMLVSWTLAAWVRLNMQVNYLPFSLASLVMLGVGLFTFFQRPHLPSARTLLMLCASFFCTAISNSLPDSLYNFQNPFALWGVGLLSYTIMVWLTTPSLLWFTLVFPRPKGIVQRWPWLAQAPYLLGLLILALIVTDERFGVLGYLGSLVMLVAAALNLVHSAFTQRDAVSQAQLRWAVGGVMLGIMVSLLTFLPAFNFIEGGGGSLLSNGLYFGFTLVSISLAIAILRYRLWDIDLILRRTLLYGLLTAALALIYFGLVVLLESLFRQVIGLAGQSRVVIVISTLSAAAMFSPLRRRIQNIIDRRFFRRRYDVELTLQRFSSTLRSEVNIDQLSRHMVQVVDETMQPSEVSLWLRRDQHGSGL